MQKFFPLRAQKFVDTRIEKDAISRQISAPDTQEILYRYFMGCTDAGDSAMRIFASSVCECQNTVFILVCMQDKTGAMRKCSACESKKYIADSWKEWDAAQLVQALCRRCDSQFFSVGVGLVLDCTDDVEAVCVVSRCASCAHIARVAHWQVPNGSYGDRENFA